MCSQIIDELRIIFNRKYPNDIKILEIFIEKLSYELVNTPLKINKDQFPHIRDIKDLPILASAMLEDVDVLITGDKDFWEVEINKPEIYSPKDFLEKYCN